jgi:hypothetical protein
MTSNIDSTKPSGAMAYSSDMRANFLAAATEITNLQNQIAILASRQQFGATVSAGSPVGTSSSTFVMQGVNVTVTIPAGATRAMVILTGEIGNSINNGQSYVQLAYGSGASPANGAPQTGTLIGQAIAMVGPVDFSPFSQNALISGLVPSSQIWVGVALRTSGVGTASLTNLQITVVTLLDPMMLTSSTVNTQE